MKQWASLVAVTAIASGKPAELVVTSLMRATFCERLAKPSRLGSHASDLFLVGLFSSIDALIDRPLEEVLSQVAVSDSVRDALLGGANPLSRVYNLVLTYERGDWERAAELARELDLDESILPEAYDRSVQWVDQVLGS